MPSRDYDYKVKVVDDAGQADWSAFMVDGIHGLSPNAGDVLEWNGTAWVNSPTSGIIVPAEYLRKDGNLAGLVDTAVARTNLGLQSAATHVDTDFQPADSDLTAIALLTTTAYGRAFLALADAAAARTALALGTAATQASTAFDAAGAAAAAQSASQPLDSDLTSIAALTTTTYGRALLTLANAAASDFVTKALFDANTVLAATTDDTPAAVTMGASTMLARLASGNIVAATPAQIASLISAGLSGRRFSTGVFYCWDNGGSDVLITPTAQLCVWRPFTVGVTPANGFDQVSVEVTTQGVGSTFLVGVYDDNNGKPGSLLFTFASGSNLDTTSIAVLNKAISPVWSPTPGVYWLAGISLGTSPIMRSRGANDLCFTGNSTAGNANQSCWQLAAQSSLPGTGASAVPGLGSTANTHPKIMLRAA